MLFAHQHEWEPAGKLKVTYRTWRLTRTEPAPWARWAVCSPRTLTHYVSRQRTGSSAVPKRPRSPGGLQTGQDSVGSTWWGRNHRGSECRGHTPQRSLPASATSESLNALYSSIPELIFKKLNPGLHLYASFPKLKTPGG